MDVKNVQNSTEAVMMVINMVYLIFLIMNVVAVRYFQKFNDLMPLMYKMKLRVLYLIPSLTILSSLIISILPFQEKPSSILFIIAVFCVQSSIFLIIYALLYFTYFSGKILNTIYINTKSKWYLDETGFKTTIILTILTILMPLKLFSLVTSNNIEEIKSYSHYIFTMFNLCFILYFFSMYKTRKYFDKMILTYIEDVSVGEEIYKEEHKRYMAYKYNSQNFTDI